MESFMAAESYGVDKENSPAPAKKRARKSSTASKRVSFSDTVSVRHIEKLDASPNASPAMSTRSRRSSLTFSAVVVTSGPAAAFAPAAAESHIMEVPSEPVRLQRMPLEPAGLVSPAPSDRSDVFFSPQESASPIVSLSSLLQQDDGFEAAVPRLANLLHQDARQANAEPNHEDVTMEMTIGVGGILAAAASSHGSPAQPVLNTPPPSLEPVQDAPASRFGEASDEDCTMDLTGTYGGIKETAAAIRWPEQTSLISEGVAPAIAAPLVAVPMPTAEPADMPSAALLPSSASDSGLSRRASSARHRRSSLGTMLGVLTEEPHEHVEAEAHPPAEEEQPPLPEEEEAVVSSKVGEKRRFSLSDKLQAVSSRLWRFTSAQDPVHEPEAEADHIASGGASAAGAAEDVLAEGGPGAAASALATFDEYLDEAGVAVEVLAVPAAERVHKVLALIVDASSGEAFCNRLMTAMVLSPELDQLHWGNQELNKCIGMLQDGYSRMEDYITENAPSFFTAPEMKIEQAKLEKLSARCRQTARVFWYDWRVTLESDLGTKLLKAQQSLDNDLAHLQQNSAQLRAAGAKIKAARPAARPAASLAALEEEAALLEAQLTQRAATVGRIEVQRSALAEAVRLAEAELVAIRAEHEAKQRELCDHRKHLCAVHEEPASLRSAALGRELLDALQIGLCWRPTVLTSSRLVLRFGDYFELRAALRSGVKGEGAVDSVEMCGLEPLQPAAGAVHQPHIVVLQALFSRVQAELAPALLDCRSTPALRALLGRASVSLGRALEIASDVEQLATRVLLSARPHPTGGVALGVRMSYLGACVRFELLLVLRTERPEAPLQWQLTQWQSADDARGKSLRETFDALAPQYTYGFGRLGGMLAALDVVFRQAAIN